MIDSKNHIQLGRRTFSTFQVAFGSLIALYALLILFTFRDYGITSDETHHIMYGEQIFRWYSSGFEDQAIFQTTNTWLYGGFFDTTAYLFSRIVPLDRYDANHLFNAFFGLLGVVAAYRIGAMLGGPFTGFLAALGLVLTPRYYGHAFNNPKDIPFAVCYLWSLYYLIQYYRTFPNLSRSCLIGTGLSIGFALGIRIGGLVLLFYLGIITAIKVYHLRQTAHATLKILLPKLALILTTACITMLICWPYALQNPISGPLDALQSFSQFTQPHTSYFAGRYVLNTALPRAYAPTWLSLTLPEFALIGILAGLYVLVIKKRPEHLILLFTGAFPIFYAVVMNTPLYDGLRHLLFAIPPLVVFGMIGICHFLQRANTRRIASIIALIFFFGATIEMIRLHPNQYIYFNTLIAGGVKHASENYETDYWENTYKQGIRWAEKNISPPKGQKIQMGGFSENVQYMLDRSRSEPTPYPERADVYLGTTRYDGHRKVPGEILHVISSADTPLLYIIRPDTSYQHDPFFSDSPFYQFRLGQMLEPQNRFSEALLAYQKSLAQALQNATTEPFYLMRVYIRIGNQYESLEQFDKALNTYLKALQYSPDNGALHNNIGIVFARLGDTHEALRWIEMAIKIDPKYVTAFVNQGGCAQQSGDFDLAREAYRRALVLKDDAALRYKLGKLEYEQGNFQESISEFQHILKDHPGDAFSLHDLAMAYAALKDYANARKTIELAIDAAPGDFRNHFTLGSIAMYQNEYQDAVNAYREAINLDPKNPDLYVGLGIAFARLGDIKNAQQALQNALALKPQHTEAQNHLQALTR
jgi:tetratricopeptide (TPR) repeat protein